MPDADLEESIAVTPTICVIASSILEPRWIDGWSWPKLARCDKRGLRLEATFSRRYQNRVRAFSVLVVGLLAVAGPAIAQPAYERARERPGPPGQATTTSIGLFLVDLMQIDDAGQTMTVDFFVGAGWDDPRVTGLGDVTRPSSEVWTPNLQILRDQSLEKTNADVVQIEKDGRVGSAQRFIGKVAYRGDLSDFPFDRQRFSIRIVSPLYSPEEVALTVNPALTGQSEELTVAGWDVERGDLRVQPYVFPPTGNQFAGVTYEFQATRKSGYYIWNVIIPVAFVVFMSWAVFWIDPANIGPQISVAITSILTLFAYRFALSTMVPRISYLTRLDTYVFGASALVCLVLVEAIWTSRLSAQGHEAQALRMDRWCQLLFPSAFVALLVVAFLF